MRRTGYKLLIDGDLSWSLYPKIGVRAARVTLTAPGKTKPFIDLKRVNIAAEPMQLLRGVSSLSGEVHIADVNFNKVHATSALVGLQWQNKELVFRPIQAAMYEGSLSGMARGKNFSGTPEWSWDITLSHVNVEPLIQDANGGKAKLKLSGKGQVRISASTSGKETKEMLRNVNGITDFNLWDGKVKGVNINFLLKTADALLNRQKVEMPKNLGDTEFQSFVGSALISNGLAQTSNLLLKSENFKVKGQGSYSLPTKEVDLSLNAESTDLKTRWEVPVVVAGTLEKPDIHLDMREINKMMAAKELTKVKDKVKKKIQDNIPGKAGEYLQNLIGE